jgi:glycine/D-amino acid oxidase-like deaminating enzyme
MRKLIRYISTLSFICRIVSEIRISDLAIGKHYRKLRWGKCTPPVRMVRFVCWTLYQLFVAMPKASGSLSISTNISTIPMWLRDPNPYRNHPWEKDPHQAIPESVDTVVIGAGFTGAASAYHWARRADADKGMVILEKDDPASGSSGRNEGLVVMGRYFKMVKDMVQQHLPTVRSDLDSLSQERLAEQFAHYYCVAAYRNGAQIAETIEKEKFQCQYVRAGWVQARTEDEQASLQQSVALAKQTNTPDWQSISSEEVRLRTGMRTDHDAGFSKNAASWHPAQWVWCLLKRALIHPQVDLFTRTAVQRVRPHGSEYHVFTNRGMLRARHIIYATESYTPQLEPSFSNAIIPMQEQAASGTGGPPTMKPHVGISGSWFFAGRYGKRVLFGSGGARLSDNEAGRNQPSRFLTRFVASEMKQHFGAYHIQMENEWSGTVGYTPDQYPIVGCMDGKGRYIIAGMCGSGSAVSFNGARCVVNRILRLTDEPDDYPEKYFAPSRLLSPDQHCWPEID